MNILDLKNKSFVAVVITYLTFVPIFNSVTYAGITLSKKAASTQPQITSEEHASDLIKTSVERDLKMSSEEAKEWANEIVAGVDYADKTKLFLTASEGLKELSRYYPIDTLKNTLIRLKNTQGGDNLAVKLSIFVVMLDDAKEKANVASETAKETILQQAEKVATTVTGVQFIDSRRSYRAARNSDVSIEQAFQFAQKAMDDSKAPTQPQSSCNPKNPVNF